MWKREDQPAASPTPETDPPRAEPPRPTGSPRDRATIGPSISIRGDVSGDEDLLIEGQVDGSVALQSHSVTVGREGRVHASITGRVITVEGHVEGDLTAEEQVVLRGTARVQGDVKAPRVVLEDGASFRGLVDMGAPAGGGKQEASRSGSDKARGGGNPAPKGGQGASTASAGGATPETRPSGDASSGGAAQGKEGGAGGAAPGRPRT